MSTVPDETRLVRSFPDGITVHKRGCPRAKSVAPWDWAEGRPDEEWMRIPWLKACKVCFPETRA